MSKVYIFINDKTKKMGKTVYLKDEEEFKRLNDEFN
jgi:hypothetical protein